MSCKDGIVIRLIMLTVKNDVRIEHINRELVQCTKKHNHSHLTKCRNWKIIVRLLDPAKCRSQHEKTYESRRSENSECALVILKSNTLPRQELSFNVVRQFCQIIMFTTLNLSDSDTHSTMSVSHTMSVIYSGRTSFTEKKIKFVTSICD